MEKPIVFLSHSSKNKRELTALKQLLDRKAVGFIDFFLSSDGESIPLGTNWVQRLNKALKKTKLMFVFVSREALQSEWLLFESGYVYGHDTHVVPYCLPGTEMKHLPSPLKLLQAHNLHCAKDLNTLVKKCNEVFATKIPEKFTAQEFKTVFRNIETPEEKTNPRMWELLVQKIEVKTEGLEGGADLFARICKRKKLDCFMESPPRSTWKQYTSSGITLTEHSEFFDPISRELVKPEGRRQYTFVLSPKLLGMTAPIINSWRKRLKGTDDFKVEVDFDFGVECETWSHELTQKLYGSEIEIWDKCWLTFRGIHFQFRREEEFGRPASNHPHFYFSRVSNLLDLHLSELITILVRQEVFLLDRQLTKQLKSAAK